MKKIVFEYCDGGCPSYREPEFFDDNHLCAKLERKLADREYVFNIKIPRDCPLEDA